jgi:hypothetical protein
MCNGPSRPPRLRPQGFSPSRRFPRMPELRGPPLARHRARLHATTVQDLSLQGSTRRNRAPLPGPLAPSSFGWRHVRVRRTAPWSPRTSPDARSFRPTFTRGAECYLVRPRVRQTSARWPVSLRGSNDVSTWICALQRGPRIPRHPQARRTVPTLMSLRRPRSLLPPACPTPLPASPPVHGSRPSWDPSPPEP